jgi:glycosyltransferase involved in cell wall biosynthesis
MPRLTVTIIAQDEADRIGATLDAIRCADEIVVVDGGSKDDTVRLCRERGCRVVERPFEDFARQKQLAADEASNDWILNLDADEVLSPELNDEIRALLSGGDPGEAAFRITMMLVFMGRVFRHGRESRDRHVRLFDRRRARYGPKSVHEGLLVDGRIGELRGVALHSSFRDLTHLIGKMNVYTTRGALELARQGRERSAWSVALSAPFYFFKYYVLRGNFRNGVPGLCWALVSTISPLLKYMKLMEARQAR